MILLLDRLFLILALSLSSQATSGAGSKPRLVWRNTLSLYGGQRAEPPVGSRGKASGEGQGANQNEAIRYREDSIFSHLQLASIVIMFYIQIWD